MECHGKSYVILCHTKVVWNIDDVRDYRRAFRNVLGDDTMRKEMEESK